MFSFRARFCSSQQTGKALVGRGFVWLDVTSVMASKRSKKEKIQLAVAVRGSRTSVLKLPIVLIHNFSTFDSGLEKRNIPLDAF